MRARIRDRQALLAISPAALKAYASAQGWSRTKPYGEHADVYVRERAPEIVLPRHNRLGDYASVVGRLIEFFSEVAEVDELALYRDLATADRDVLRLRIAESDDGSVAASDGIELMQGGYNMLAAAARSLDKPRSVYRGRVNQDAADFLAGVRLGQTEQGSFVVTLLAPAPAASVPQLSLDNEWAPQPFERRVTNRLAEALGVTRDAAKRSTGDAVGTFEDTVERGVSANLCDALVKAIGRFQELDVTLSRALTRPAGQTRQTFPFSAADVPVLEKAARLFKEREPRPGEELIGVVRMLTRDADRMDGEITLATRIDGRKQSVAVRLTRLDYSTAIDAHRDKAPVAMQGNLERVGQRWRLENPRIVDVIRGDETPSEDGAGAAQSEQ